MRQRGKLRDLGRVRRGFDVSTKHYDAAREEALIHVSEWVAKNVPAGATLPRGAHDAVAEALLRLIAKRDERIEALERRLAALEGDAK